MLDTVQILVKSYSNACHSNHHMSAYAMRIIHSALRMTRNGEIG